MSRVVVTGLGAVTPLGVGVQRSWRRLVDGHSGIVSLTNPNSRSRISPQDAQLFSRSPCHVAGVVPRGPKSEGGWTASEWVTPDEEHRMALFTQYAIAAAQEALEDAQWLPKTDKQKEYTAICVGSGIGSFEDVFDTSVAFAEHGYKKVSPLFVPKLLINLAAGHIAMRYGFGGPNQSPTSACTTGAHAISDAARLIMMGHAPVAIAGAAESCIHPLAVAGFARARSLSTNYNDTPLEASRPFDRNRDGFVMGEGAGIVVLEAEEHAIARGAHIYAELAGYASTGDAYHMTAPPSDGQGARRAMKRALRNAQMYPSDIDYINAHATGTKIGDLAENRAIREVFNADALDAGIPDYKPDPRPRALYHKASSELAVSSNKGAIGHLLGAAGAVEAIFTILSLKEGIVPPTLNLDTFDDSQGDRWSLTFPRPATGGALKRDRIRAALTNSFGFGGTNASLCFRHFEHDPLDGLRDLYDDDDGFN